MSKSVFSDFNSDISEAGNEPADRSAPPPLSVRRTPVDEMKIMITSLLVHLLTTETDSECTRPHVSALAILSMHMCKIYKGIQYL